MANRYQDAIDELKAYGDTYEGTVIVNNSLVPQYARFIAGPYMVKLTYAANLWWHIEFKAECRAEMAVKLPHNWSGKDMGHFLHQFLWSLDQCI